MSPPTLSSLLLANESRKLSDPVRSLYGSNFVHDVKQYEQQQSEDGLPLYGLHYSDYPKWGLNPRTRYFPKGIYFYFLKPSCDASLGNGFGTDRKYANIGKLNLDRFLVISQGNPRHFDQSALSVALEKLKVIYGDDSVNHAETWNGKLEMDGIGRRAQMVLKLFQVIFGIQRRYNVQSFNKVFHEAGFDGILDIDGQFLPIESCQGVQTWPGDAVEFVQALRTPFRRERDGFEARTHNPYPEERTKRSIKHLSNYKPGTLKLTDQQFAAIVSHVHKDKKIDMIANLLHRADLSLTDQDEISYASRLMTRYGNLLWDILEKNPTTPEWFWHYLQRNGDSDAVQAANDMLAAKSSSNSTLHAVGLKEVLDLEEAAVSFKDLTNSPVAMHVFKDEQNDRGKVIVLYRPEVLAQYMDDWETFNGLIVGFIRVRPSDFNPKVWETKGSAAEKGYGPVMYDIAMSLISPAYLMADRSVVSDQARKVWKYMYDHRMAEYDVIDLPPFYRWSNLNPESPNHELPWLDFAYRLRKKLPVYSSLYTKDSKFFAGIDDQYTKRQTLDTLEELAWTYFRDRTEPFGI